MHAAVVGHVEWIEFARVEQVPAPGEIVHALETWEEPAGGGAVAAVQLAKLAGGATFFTALGRRRGGTPRARELTRSACAVEVAWRDEPQRRGFVYVDAAGERTITVIGSRLGPSGDDPCPGSGLSDADAVYFTAGDADGRRAPPGRQDAWCPQRAAMDALARGARGARRPGGQRRGRRRALRARGPRSRAAAGGAHGRRRRRSLGACPAASAGRWAAAPLPGPISDAYGCGDSFAGGLTYGLGAGMGIDDALAWRPAAARPASRARARTRRQLSAGTPDIAAATAVPAERATVARSSGSSGSPCSAHATARRPCCGRRSRWRGTPVWRAPSARPPGSRRPPGARDRSTRPPGSARRTGGGAAPAIRPASCSWGSRTSISSIAPSACSSATRSGCELVGVRSAWS